MDGRLRMTFREYVKYLRPSRGLEIVNGSRPSSPAVGHGMHVTDIRPAALAFPSPGKKVRAEAIDSPVEQPTTNIQYPASNT